ncbi:MAG: hypothetical protein ACPGU3_06590 [Litorivicinus sp.]
MNKFIVLLALVLGGCAVNDPRDSELPENIPTTEEFSTTARESLDRGALIERSVLPSNQPSQPRERRREVVGVRQEAPVNLPQTEPLRPLDFPITAKFDDTRLESVYELFAKTAGYSLVLSDGVKAELDNRLTFDVSAVPWQQAFDLIVNEAQITPIYDDVARVLRLIKNDEYDTLVAGLLEQRNQRITNIDAFRRLETLDPLAPKRIERIYLNHIKPVEAKAKLELALATLYGFPPSVATTVSTPQPLTSDAAIPAGFEVTVGDQPAVPTDEQRAEFERFIPAILVDNENGSLLLRGTRRQLDEAFDLLDEIDVLPRQIVLEAFFVEVKDSFEQELGVRLSGVPNTDNLGFASQSQLGGVANSVSADQALFDFRQTGFDGAAFTVVRGIGSGLLRLELQALEKEGFSKTVSSPKILTTSGRAGKIKQDLNFVYRGPSTTSVDDRGTPDDPLDDLITTNPGDEQNATATLGIDAVPVAVGDKIHLDLALKNIVFTEALEGLDRAPSTSSVDVATSLVLANNEIVVIGGVALDSASLARDKVPGIADVPGVGRAFQGNDTNEEFTKLLIFLAPRIL